MRGRMLDARGQSGLAPEFLVSPAMLDAVSPAGDRGGMVLGSGMNNEPLAVSVLRPSPTRIVCVGGLYLARQLALRAMATGAWVVVATARPAAWQVLAKAAGEGPAVGQAQLAGRIWRLPPPLVQQLTALKEDQVVALGRNLWRPLRLVTTPREQQILGPVRRGD